MRQRALIAMAIIGRPSLLIADEPTTALDVTTQAQILALLKRLQREHDMALVLITHDIGVVASTADNVAVMYAGRIVEAGDVVSVLTAPDHPYTTGLLDSVAQRDDEGGAPFRALPGAPPDLAQVGASCRFAERCALRQSRCVAEIPQLELVPDVDSEASGHLSACWRHPSASADLAEIAAE
jgi:oligopeptide/dipeptide ABC transporter ATP-binding protein